ncbi:MAG: GNAT family N-acetyltransferase [Gaiellaceae bacterium]
MTELRDVILRDGSTLRLRPPHAADAEALLAFFADLSERSRYLRFHGLPELGRGLVEPWVEPNWTDIGALIGSLGDPGEERVVALASYARLREPRTAEVAFAVADDLQGRGVGTRLLEQLAALAGEAGIEQFVAVVMPENRLMLAVFEDAGFKVGRALEGGEIEVRFPIAATETYQEAVDERDHVAVTASLTPFFRPASVAVVGASRRRGSIGGELFRNILEADFSGAAFPINVKGEPVAGVRAYTKIGEIPDEVDLAVICLPGERVLEACEEALQKGVRALCVISAGFAEIGREGVERQAQLLAMARAHGARIVGPNCLGIASAAVNLNATFAPRAFPTGRIGFSSQSGALGLALLERAEARGLGLSAFVSIGNKADVSSNDLLEYWEDDPETDLVLLYLESFGNPRKFARIARRLARRKPILAMKSGTTRAGQRATASHTAALAGSEAAVDALFHQAGVIRAGSLGELLDIASLLSSQPLSRGRRVALITNAGGLGILGADACEAAGLELTSLTQETKDALMAFLPSEASVENPIDMLGSATAESYAKALPLILADPGIDSLIALFVPPVAVTADDVGAAIAAAAATAPPEKTVLASIIAAGGAPATLGAVPSFAYPESAARALGRVCQRADWLRASSGTVPALNGIDQAAATEIIERALGDDATDAWLVPDYARGLLEAYGIPMVGERVVESVDDAVSAAAELGYPVVVKTAAAGAHKTEQGGVALDLEDEEAVRAAVAQIGLPVLLQPMVKGGAELLAGVVQDPMFGPLVAFGPGGVFAELIGQAGFRLAPLTDVDARELVTSGKAGTLVAGFRGRPPSDERALVELVLRLARLAEDLPEVAELDLNPVVGLEQGCVAVDARIRVSRATGQSGQLKTW